VEVEYKPLNMDPYEDVLDQLSEEDLINFIKKRAEVLKLEL
jgi:hypothetical protein